MAGWKFYFNGNQIKKISNISIKESLGEPMKFFRATMLHPNNTEKASFNIGHLIADHRIQIYRKGVLKFDGFLEAANPVGLDMVLEGRSFEVLLKSEWTGVNDTYNDRKGEEILETVPGAQPGIVSEYSETITELDITYSDIIAGTTVFNSENLLKSISQVCKVKGKDFWVSRSATPAFKLHVGVRGSGSVGAPVGTYEGGKEVLITIEKQNIRDVVNRQKVFSSKDGVNQIQCCVPWIDIDIPDTSTSAGFDGYNANCLHADASAGQAANGVIEGEPYVDSGITTLADAIEIAKDILDGGAMTYQNVSVHFAKYQLFSLGDWIRIIDVKKNLDITTRIKSLVHKFDIANQDSIEVILYNPFKTIEDKIIDIKSYASSVSSESVTTHPNLTNLGWAASGHFIDTLIDMNANYIQSIKSADAYSNVLPNLFVQQNRDNSNLDFYSAFHSYVPASVAASQSNHRIFGISSEIHTEGLAHLVYADDTLNGAINAEVVTITVDSTTGFDTSGLIQIESEWISYIGTTSTTFTGCTRGQEGTTAAAHNDGITVMNGFTHTVALYGGVVSGKEPGNDSCQIWGLNTLIESQYDSGDSKGFEQHMQGYECDVNRALPHVMKKDSGDNKYYANYYSSGDKGTELTTAAEMLVALNKCIGVNATGINTGNPGIAYNVAGGGSAYWNVGVMLDYPFQYAAIILGDAQKIMWKNGTTGNYEERLRNSAADFHITAGTGGDIILNSEVNVWSNKIVSLAEPTANSDAATKYYIDNALDAYQLLSEKDVANGYVGYNSALDIDGKGSGLGLTPDTNNIFIGENTNNAQVLLMTNSSGIGTHYFKAYLNKGTTGNIWDEIITLASPAILSSTQKTDLTDGGDSTLHYHASDRALANATGTLADSKIASTICRDSELSTHAALSASVHGMSSSGFQDKDEKDVNSGYTALSSGGNILAPGSGLYLTPDTGNIIIGDRNTSETGILLVRNSSYNYTGYINKGSTGNAFDEIITLSKKNAASGYAGLDASSNLDMGTTRKIINVNGLQLPVGTDKWV